MLLRWNVTYISFSSNTLLRSSLGDSLRQKPYAGVGPASDEAEAKALDAAVLVKELTGKSIYGLEMNEGKMRNSHSKS